MNEWMDGWMNRIGERKKEKKRFRMNRIEWTKVWSNSEMNEWTTRHTFGQIFFVLCSIIIFIFWVCCCCWAHTLYKLIPHVSVRLNFILFFIHRVVCVCSQFTFYIDHSFTIYIHYMAVSIFFSFFSFVMLFIKVFLVFLTFDQNWLIGCRE